VHDGGLGQLVRFDDPFVDHLSQGLPGDAFDDDAERDEPDVAIAPGLWRRAEGLEGRELIEDLPGGPDPLQVLQNQCLEPVQGENGHATGTIRVIMVLVTLPIR
jgi:hypothetical protein